MQLRYVLVAVICVAVFFDWKPLGYAQPAPNATTGYSCPVHYTFDPATELYEPLPAGLLWRVQAGPGGAPSYVFGTFHSASPVIKAKLKKVNVVLPQVRVVALELLLSDPAVNQQFQQAMRLTPGHTLQGMIGRERFVAAADALRAYQITPDAANQLTVWAVAVILSMSPEEFASSETLDGFIEQAAQAEGKRLVSLESVTEQIALFQSLTLEQQIAFLESSLAMLGERDAMIARMKVLYAEEKLEALDAISDAMFQESGDEGLQDWVEEQLLEARNDVMVERMLPLLQQGGVLVAVGALHLPGEEGLLYALERQGYCLSPVHP